MSNLKIEIGSGPYPTEGYLHFDINRTAKNLDIQCDALNLPIKDNSVEELLSVNILEHIEWTEVRSVLKEWTRVIKVGGIIKIHVPDLYWLITFFHDKKSKWKENVGTQPLNAANDKWEYFNHYVMSTNAKYNLHRSVYTQEFLQELLKENNFGNFIRIYTDPRWLYLQATKLKG